MIKFKEFLNAKTPSVPELADKHNVSTKEIEKLIKKGTAEEKEHSSHKGVAKEIAMDHISAKKNYYKLLKKHVE
jgi:hypothetical protein